MICTAVGVNPKISCFPGYKDAIDVIGIQTPHITITLNLQRLSGTAQKMP